MPVTAQDAEKFGANLLSRFQQAQAFASHWRPRQVAGYVVNNAFFMPWADLNDSAVEQMLNFLQQNGAFRFTTDERTGLVQTSDTEQAHMNSRQWITDSCMVGFWQRQAQPEHWQRNMATSAAVMNHPAACTAIAQTLADPNWYRQGPLQNGVFHLYYRDSLQLDDVSGCVAPESVQLDSSWENQKRLESQAQLLYCLSSTLLASPVLDPANAQPWGFSSTLLDSPAGQHIVAAVMGLTRFLLAANTEPYNGQPTFETPSASSWEEYPFPEGMTSDAAFTVLALESVHQLLGTIKYQPVPACLQPLIGFVQPETLQRWIAAGRSFIRQRITDPLTQGLHAIQTSSRPADMSLTLLAASAFAFNTDNPLADAETRLRLVQDCKHQLCGPYGMRRFNEYTLNGALLHDNYLNVCGNFPRSLYAHFLGVPTLQGGYPVAGEHASDAATLLARQETSRFDYSAQWGIGLSASVQAMARARQTVVSGMAAEADGVKAQALLRQIDAELLDSLNRCLAAIPGPMTDNQRLIRADGTVCPPYAAMEAWQVMLTENGQPAWVPGAHTLPWHAAQLWDGFHRVLASLPTA